MAFFYTILFNYNFLIYYYIILFKVFKIIFNVLKSIIENVDIKNKIILINIIEIMLIII